MFVFTRISFERGLIQYMDKVHENNMTLMAQELSDIYAQNGSWESFKENPDLWVTIQRYAFRKWRHDMGGLRFRQNPHHQDVHGETPDAKAWRPEERKKNRPRFYLLDQFRNPVYPIGNEPIPKNLQPVF